MRRELTVVGLLAAVAALLVFLLVPSYPGYDTYYHLVWGRELLDGQLPSYVGYVAPTPHPLFVALMAPLSLFGESADRLSVLICLLSFAAVVTAIYALARAIFNRWVAAVAGLIVALNISLLLYAMRAYVDLPYLALVLWAAVVILVKPERRYLPLVLLTLAGLLRPEAWLLAGCYLLWFGYRAAWPVRFRLAALTATAPLLWCLTDFLITDRPLFSLTSTSDLAGQLERKSGLARVPWALLSNTVSVMRLPVAALAAVGLVLALYRYGIKKLAVPLLLIASGVVTFAANGAFGLTLIPRYLLLPATVAVIFAAYALVGFSELALKDRWRRYWIAASCAALLLATPFVLAQRGSVNRLDREFTFVRESHQALRQIATSAAAREGLRCGPITLPNYRLGSDLRWMLDLPSDRVGARSERRHRYGVAIFALTQRGLSRYGFASGASITTNLPDPGYRRVSSNRYFALYINCPEDR